MMTLVEALDTIDLLKEENRQLRALLVPEKFEFFEFGLTPRQRQLLAILMAASPNLCSSERAFNSIWLDRPDTYIKVADVILCQLRKKLKAWDIEIVTVWGQGWCIDAANRAKVFAVVEALGGLSEMPAERRVA